MGSSRLRMWAKVQYECWDVEERKKHWTGIIKWYEESRMSLRAFCIAENIPKSALRHQLKKSKIFDHAKKQFEQNNFSIHWTRNFNAEFIRIPSLDSSSSFETKTRRKSKSCIGIVTDLRSGTSALRKADSSFHPLYSMKDKYYRYHIKRCLSEPERNVVDVIGINPTSTLSKPKWGW